MTKQTYMPLVWTYGTDNKGNEKQIMLTADGHWTDLYEEKEISPVEAFRRYGDIICGPADNAEPIPADTLFAKMDARLWPAVCFEAGD